MARSDQEKQETASQTAGPYVHIGLVPSAAGLAVHPKDLGCSTAGPQVQGTGITVKGTVFDGAGDSVKDAIIEVWQADGAGLHAGAAARKDGFTGWARVVPDFETGAFTFDTVKPGALVHPTGIKMAPHLNLWIVARGINIGLNTRMYFPQDVEANENDPVLASIVPKSRRDTLVARRDGQTYHFDIHLQGPQETVFFDV